MLYKQEKKNVTKKGVPTTCSSTEHKNYRMDTETKSAKCSGLSVHYRASTISQSDYECSTRLSINSNCKHIYLKKN